MNLHLESSNLNIDLKKLTDKKQQTDKKIQYVKEYVHQWAIINAERSQIDTITFIDCMCNAGIYRDGDYCTCIEVLTVFTELSKRYTTKTFQILCNDFDEFKIQTLNKVIKLICPDPRSNLKIKTYNMDVNAYLDGLNKNPFIETNKIFQFSSAVLLYVDPFDFATVEISKISSILQNYYCELIFNFFLSDFIRNNSHHPERFIRCLNGKTFSSKSELINYIRSQLHVGYIKYLFSYSFRITNNVELYQIIFATPNVRGLEVLKEILWKVFNGAQFHRNSANIDQCCLFSPEYDKKQYLRIYSDEAIKLLLSTYSHKTVSYKTIETLLIENTMLKDSQIIRNVIKPMIESRQIRKCGLSNARNYKQDQYQILS